MSNKPPRVLTIEDFAPMRAVEGFRRKHGYLPGENAKADRADLLERMEIAAQACRAAHLLSCEATVHEAIEALQQYGVGGG